jgi:aspartate aminotransferase/aminotransferase
MGPSGIRRIFDLGASLKDPIDLSIGQPDFLVPDPVKQTLIKAIETNCTGYTNTRGIPELREAIQTHLRNTLQWDVPCIATSGLSGGLVLACLACLDPGDEVLLADPYFVSYPHLVRIAGACPVLVSTYGDFQLHPERFEAAVTPRTRMILIASPGNPTGVVYRREDLKALAEIARKHDLLIVSDEIYESLVYDGPSATPVSFAPERTLLLRGFGKSHALTGLRIAYAAGPERIINELAKIQQYTFVCAPHPSQHAAITALTTDMSMQVADYSRKRDFVCDRLEGVMEFMRPSGGFYVFPRVPASYASAHDFVAAAIKRNLLIIPGGVFSTLDTHVRISYAASDEKLARGCAILRGLACV